jgi:hypothetical protein
MDPPGIAVVALLSSFKIQVKEYQNQGCPALLQDFLS